MTLGAAYGIVPRMSEQHFTDPAFEISVDPFAWRSHSLWCALANYTDLLDSSFSKIAQIMIDNILSIMKADFLNDHEESRILRDLFNYRQKILARHAPAAWRPESIIV